MADGIKDKMALSGGVYYERYGDTVYLRNTDTRKDYLFNKISYDILNCFSKKNPRGIDAVTETLISKYEVEDEAALGEDIHNFINRLNEEKILVPEKDIRKDGVHVIERVKKLCTDRRILYSIGLEMTYRCNERCVHCYIDEESDSRDELTLSEYKKLIDEARGMGCINILLTGGEVCMKPCFPEVAEYAASSGMLVDIYTNGIAMNDEMFDRICALKPNSLSYSLYGSNKHIHDSITHVAGSFDRTLRYIMMTKCAGIDTYIKTVAMKENFSDMEGLIKLGKRIGIDVTPGLTILDTHSGASRESHRLDRCEDYQEIIRLFEKYYPGITGIGERDIDSAVCGAGQCSLCIDPYGEVFPCLSMRTSLGNIRKNGIKEIWYESGKLTKIRDIKFHDICSSCHECKYSCCCNICMGQLHEAGSKMPDEVCMLAKATFQVKMF